MTVCKKCLIDKEDTKDNWYFFKGKRHGVKCKSCVLKGRKTEHELSMSRKRDRERYENNPKRRQAIYESSKRRWLKKGYRPVHNKTDKCIKKLGIRPSVCPICGYEGRIIAHHPDYSEWNKIVFCCQICHDKIHKGIVTNINVIDLLNQF